jgi:hypothetical protein
MIAATTTIKKANKPPKKFNAGITQLTSMGDECHCTICGSV